MATAADLEGVPPLIAQLIRNIRVQVTLEDAELMKRTDVKELRLFFDALSSGQAERKTYEDILKHIHDRRDGASREDAAKRAKEDAERKAKEDAERRAREASEKLAAERKEKEDRERKAKEEAAKQAEAAAKLAEEARAREAALEAKRKAAEEEARIKRRVGKCAHCNDWIEDKDFLENGDMKLHNKCLEAWQRSNCSKCVQCKQPILDDFVEVTAGDGGDQGTTVELHPDCVDPYKIANRPKCAQCGNVIMENSRMKLGANFYHNACAPKK